jgi:hypothetical protein
VFERIYRFLEIRRNFLATGTLFVWLPAWAILAAMLAYSSTVDLQDIVVLGLITLAGAFSLSLVVWIVFARIVIADIAAQRDSVIQRSDVLSTIQECRKVDHAVLISLSSLRLSDHLRTALMMLFSRRHNLVLNLVLLAGLLFAFVWLLQPAVLNGRQPEWLIASWFVLMAVILMGSALAIALLSKRAAGVSNPRVLISEVGLTFCGDSGKPVSFPWSEVNRVERVWGTLRVWARGRLVLVLPDQLLESSADGLVARDLIESRLN